jgi:S-adenosyl-L-methionine hydrolase (adenosine-forming)
VAIVTILTDFGLKDSYVGTMKGVILTIDPGATIVDITHGIEPQDIREAAFVVEEYYRFFLTGTIHLAIVDPTVGSGRRALIVVRNGHIFVGPDNGLFTLLTGNAEEIRVIGNRQLMLENRSSTFHGRDIFAPAAAYLAAGTQPSAFGPQVTDPVRLGDILPKEHEGVLEGRIVRFDRFGNAISNIKEDTLEAFAKGRPFTVSVANRTFVGISRSYYEAPVTCLFDSSGYLEFGAFKGSFQAEFSLEKDELVLVRPTGSPA